jgi:long-chain acyl-CoA synthetase
MEYPWFEEYKTCGIPFSLEPYPDEPSHFFIDRAACHFPRMGCVQLGLELPYPEVRRQADRLAGALAGMGIGKGDRVATLLPTSIQFVLADTAISKSGAVHVPCSFLESGENLGRKFAESSPKALICLDDHIGVAEQLRENMDGGTIIATNLYDFSARPPARKDLNGALQLLDVIEQAGPNAPEIRFDPARDLETLLFTGGTTGIAKGCMLTHRNVVANAIQNPVVFGPTGNLFRGNMSVMMGNPFFHSYGHSMFHTMSQMCFTLLLLPDPRDYKTMLAMVKEYHPVLQVGVPTQFMNLLDEDTKKARVIGICGSAPLRPNTQEQFEERGAGVVTEGYGLSELTAVSHFNVSALIRLNGGRKMLKLLNATVFGKAGTPILRAFAKLTGPKFFGRQFMFIVSMFSLVTRRLAGVKNVERRATIGIPLPDTEVRVLDVKTGEPIPLEELARADKSGELLIRGPQTMLGYWPEEGKGLDPEGFVHTGDVVKMDENGYFSIVDRIKDMVIVSGFKVYTREIDDTLHEHPATESAATIGVPDPAKPGSEYVVVFVQLTDECKGAVTEDDYLEFLRNKVAKYAVPRTVTFIDEMPMTEVFKIKKNELREIALRQLEKSRPG